MQFSICFECTFVSIDHFVRIWISVNWIKTATVCSTWVRFETASFCKCQAWIWCQIKCLANASASPTIRRYRTLCAYIVGIIHGKVSERSKSTRRRVSEAFSFQGYFFFSKYFGKRIPCCPIIVCIRKFICIKRNVIITIQTARAITEWIPKTARWYRQTSFRIHIFAERTRSVIL